MIKLFVISILVTSCAQLKKVAAPDKEEQAFTVSWAKDLDPSYSTGNKPIGYSSPYIFEDIVYMGGMDGYMRAYDLETGKVLWEKNEKFSIQAPAGKYGTNVIYGTQSGRVFSRNYLTGKLNYSIDLEAPVESRPVFAKGRMFIHLRNHTIVSLDATSGKVFWRYRRSIPYTTTLQRVSKALPYKNNLIVGFADGNLVSLSIEEGVVAWEQKLSTGLKFVDVDVTPMYFGGSIVAGSAAGPMRFINPKNGQIIRTVEFNQSHVPVLEGKNLIVGSVFGDVYRVDQFGKVIQKVNISHEGISSIKHWKNGFIVSTVGKEVFYLDKGLNNKGAFNLGADESAVFGDVEVSEERAALYSSRNRLYIFK